MYCTPRWWGFFVFEGFFLEKVVWGHRSFFFSELFCDITPPPWSNQYPLGVYPCVAVKLQPLRPMASRCFVSHPVNRSTTPRPIVWYRISCFDAVPIAMMHCVMMPLLFNVQCWPFCFPQQARCVIICPSIHMNCHSCVPPVLAGVYPL